MAFKDCAAGLGPILRPLLGIGERLLAAAPITEDTTTDDVTTLLRDRSTMHRIVPRQRTVAGCETIAHRWADRLNSVAEPQLAVTDQRLLIFTTVDVSERHTGWQRWFAPAEVVARQVHTVPREGILGAARAQQPPGRLVIGFADGSGCVLMCAPASVAETMAQAIGS